ncbi:GNAT family N-acetyltransferase [Streptomyces solincola]|uniref:GNAT family N-acetyltransferase n=1 Tax=Streptomyces solincola TaxID=2100817 RepID=A0A2S9PQE9_9ACTN|nr:GNAT family N-acetyltransferase [Streptomyces solincola]PRH76634.1 GNAT family N-acetyltransferase [Streptomyces solincola]
MTLTVRPYRPGDAAGIAALYSRHRDGPNPVAGGITAAQLDQELTERATALFLVAVDDERPVGTFGLFHGTGRRTARAGELIADMFFVAPAYRGGALTGRLFTDAVEWMVRSGCLVLRLTVNPANTTAFRLYRRVGCVCLGRTTPGEDGNIELHNHIPLILRSVLADLDEHARQALFDLSSFAGVTDLRDGELGSDVELVDGVRTVSYVLHLGEHRLTATVDADRGLVRSARLTSPDGAARAVGVEAPPYRVRTTTGRPPHRFTSGDLSGELDPDDGTLRVLAAGHHGPLLVSSWPGGPAGRPASWREAEPRDLTVRRVPHGVRVTERRDDAEVTGTLTLRDGVLCQEFTGAPRPGHLFQTVGLRQGVVAPGDGSRHPIGLGLGVRDASEIVAAGHRVPVGGRTAWHGPSWSVELSADTPVRLVHATLLRRTLVPGPDGVARLRTALTPRTSPAPLAPPVLAPPPGPRRIHLDAGTGGVTSWREGSVRVLRCPHPRTRTLGSNPQWRAGMWVTAETHRSDRAHGLGWGVPSPAPWHNGSPSELDCPDEGIAWQVSGPEGPGTPVRVDIRAPGAPEETVLWLTPHTPRTATVAVASGGGRHELSTDGFRQVWADAVAVRLTDGHWLHCRPADPTAATAEIVVRATPAGPLVGCAAPARSGPAWLLTVSEHGL